MYLSVTADRDSRGTGIGQQGSARALYPAIWMAVCGLRIECNMAAGTSVQALERPLDHGSYLHGSILAVRL